MATKFFRGTADAVAQVTSVGINAFDAATTYGITIGGVTVSTAGITDEQTTTDNLVTALNASTHPYFSAITWARTGSGSSSEVRGTADTAGVPFTLSTSAAGGTGSWNSPTTSTASAGPNDWSTATNWSDGVVPANTDTVILRDCAVNICWGIDQSSVTLASLQIEASYTGRIGLSRKAFATSADGATVNTAKGEYREDYLKIGADVISIGQNLGPSTPVGSGRIKIDQKKSGASALTVHGTANASVDTGLPAVRYLAAHASADVYVRSAPGGFGIAVDEPGETSTVGAVRVSDPTTSSKVIVGSGVTLTTYEQDGGVNLLQAAATVTTVSVNGGVLSVEGDFTITTETVNDGTVYENHTKASGNAITTLTINGGIVDATQSRAARTWATVNPDGGVIKADSSVVTITTLDKPAGIKSLTVEAL